MVDGVVVLVDAAEGADAADQVRDHEGAGQGPAADRGDQQGRPPDARPHEVHNEVFDLFAALGADDDQLDFPTLFASGRNGWAATSLEAPRENLAPLFDLIVAHVPAPKADPDAPFAMLATTLESDPYLGRILTGRIDQRPRQGQHGRCKSLSRDGQVIEKARLTKLLAFRGLERVPVEEAEAGDIIAIAGLTKTTVADTLCDPAVDDADPGHAGRSADPRR